MSSEYAKRLLVELGNASRILKKCAEGISSAARLS